VTLTAYLTCDHCGAHTDTGYALHLYGSHLVCEVCASIEAEAWSWEYRLIHGEEGE
jgi:hypothetical protein